MKLALIEAVKELLRVIVLAAIPLLIDGLIADAINWRIIGITAAIAGLRFIDKLLHEYGKETENEQLTKGLTQF